MEKQLVVSHYEQDLFWVSKTPQSLNPIIYDKSNKSQGFIKLENKGREPHTYIHHIIENYNSLAKWTIFSQDNPFVHVHDWESIILGDKNLWEVVATYQQPGCYFFSNMGVLTSDIEGFPHHPGLPIENLWNNTFEQSCPTHLYFTPSCHFIIHKDAIHIRTLDFYKNLKNILETDYASPWAFERYTSYIFNSKYN